MREQAHLHALTSLGKAAIRAANPYSPIQLLPHVASSPDPEVAII